MLGVSGCATREGSETSEAKTLAQPTLTDTPRGSAAVSEVRGETALAYGDDQTATKLLERSVAEHPTALSEFNLGAAYARTGRIREAIGMYGRATGDGVNQTMILSGPVGSATVETRPNISDEARLRAALLEASLKPGMRDPLPLTVGQAARADEAK